MSKIALHTTPYTGVTILQNEFIDNYMPAANGAYVKVYLYLLRCLCDSTLEVSTSFCAEKLDETEKDIERALHYWEKMRLLHIERDTSQEIISLSFCFPSKDAKSTKKETKESHLSLNASNEEIQQSAEITQAEVETSAAVEPISTINRTASVSTNPTVPSLAALPKPSYSQAQIAELTQMDEVKFILATLEQYMERPLKSTEIQLVLFLFENIGFSSELILYLFEYCISKNKKSVSYIETVALSWAQEGIDTVEKAENTTMNYNQNYNTVNRAFGLNRAPGNIEKKFIYRWFQTFHFDSVIVEEACNRTMLTTGKPDFKYTDKILENWHINGVTKKDDIAKLDEKHAKLSIASKEGKVTELSVKTSPNNRFNAFPQREYSKEEYLSMEQRLLNRKP